MADTYIKSSTKELINGFRYFNDLDKLDGRTREEMSKL